MSTFGSFNTVRLGIYASQKGLDVTGNNITNINTVGYTRQRLEQTSLVTTASDRYYSRYKTRVGQGVLTTGVTQLRDPGLDISYRKAQADLGSADAKLAGLEDLARILDEVGKGDGEQDDGVILNQMNDLRDLISGAITNGIAEYDPLIRESATSLTALFRDYASQLEQMVDKYKTRLSDQVDTVNDILSGIQKLNISIRNADIRGDEALELRDQRNLLLDELSQYVKIDVKYSMEGVGAGLEVEKLTVSLATGDDKNTLVDGEYATQFQLNQTLLVRNEHFDPTQDVGGNNLPYVDGKGDPATAEDAAKVENDNYTLVLGPLTDLDGEKKSATDFGVDLGDTDLYGALQSTREMLTEKGEFATAKDQTADPDAAIKRGIPYYQLALDSLAKEFAEMFNQTNHLPFDQVQYAYEMDVDNFFVDADGNRIQGLDTDGQPKLLEADDFDLGTIIDSYQKLDANLSDEEAEEKAKALMYQNLEILRQQGVLLEGYESYTGGPLFSTSSNNNTTTGITAANISVSKDWAEGKVSIQATVTGGAPSGDTSNLAKFLNLFNREDIAFDPGDVNTGATGATYTGSFEDMLLRIQSTLAEDQKTTTALLTNYTVTHDEIYTDRDSVMGVDLNDEATSLMVYQKAYTAACRLMTVLEEALDSLINGTIV